MADNLVVDVGFEQYGTDLAQGLGYLAVGQPAKAQQLPAELGEAVGQCVEHLRARITAA